MSKKDKYAAIEEIVVKFRNGKEKRIKYMMTVPKIEKYDDDENAWACYPSFKGTSYDYIDKPAYGLTSFQAIVEAISVIRQIIEEEAKGGKIYRVEDVISENELSDVAVKLDDLFT